MRLGVFALFLLGSLVGQATKLDSIQTSPILRFPRTFIYATERILEDRALGTVQFKSNEIGLQKDLFFSIGTHLLEVEPKATFGLLRLLNNPLSFDDYYGYFSEIGLDIAYWFSPFHFRSYQFQWYAQLKFDFQQSKIDQLGNNKYNVLFYNSFGVGGLVQRDFSFFDFLDYRVRYELAMNFVPVIRLRSGYSSTGDYYQQRLGVPMSDYFEIESDLSLGFGKKKQWGFRYSWNYSQLESAESVSQVNHQIGVFYETDW